MGQDFEPLRYGKVSSVDLKKGTARIFFEDRDDAVTAELPVLQKNTMTNKFYWMPQVGETAACLYATNEQETGIIIGTIYSEVDTPPTDAKNGKVDGVWYEDGTVIKYDHTEKTLDIKCTGKMIINVENDLTITAKGKITVTDERGVLL